VYSCQPNQIQLFNLKTKEENMSYLNTVKQYANQSDIKTIPLWDIVFSIQPLSFGETMDLSKVLSADDVSELNQTVELISAMVTDPDGVKLFNSPEGKEVLKSKSVEDVKKLLDICLSVAKFDTDKQVETAAKN